MSLTAIRGKDWAFHALWAACGAYHQKADPHGDEIVSNCILDIPFTCIFQNGMPIKALMTDQSSGKLKRVYVEKIDASGVEAGKYMQGSTLHPLQGMRKCLLDFSAMNAYDVQQQFRDESFIATVIYSDDQVEDLSLKTLDMLLRNETWRLQVLLIQGYVPASSVQKGMYSRKPQVRSKVDTSITATADVMSQSVAKYIERAYLLNSQQLLPSKQAAGASQRGVSLHIDNMQCRFGLDHQNKVVFLYTDYMAVEMERDAQKEVEDVVRTEKNAREQSAAEKVHRELINLLTQAHQRGLTVESSFEHFDVAHEGFVDVDRLIDGLARLGIGVTYPVGEMIMQRIGGISSSFFTFSDFERHLNGYLGEFDMVTDNKAMESKIAETQRTDRKKKASQRESKKLQELMPPPKPQRVVPLNTTWDLGASQESYPFAQVSSTIKHGSGAGEKVLPLPEEMYDAVAASASLTSVQSSARGLPKWASNRSRRALRQIQATELTRSVNHSLSGTHRGTDAETVSTAGTVPTASSSASSGKRSKTGGSPSRKTRKEKLAPLDFQTIQLQEAMVHSTNGPLDPTATGSLSLAPTQVDELLHIDQGVIMTYRILDGLELQREGMKTREAADDLRYRSIMSAREREMKKAEDRRLAKEREQEARHDLMYNQQKAGQPRSSSPDLFANVIDDNGDDVPAIQPPDAFTLIVVPDLSMTLDTLQSHLEVLLHTHPYIRIVLVGLIGLPNTIWPKTWVLNSELQAKCIAYLINHLHTTNRLFFDMNRLQAFDDGREHLPLQSHLLTMGFGTGGYHLARSIQHYLPSITQPYSLAEHIRMVILVNGVLKVNKKFRLICRDLREALVRANIFEANELLTSLHLSDEYLTRQEQLTVQQTGQKGGREAAFQKFWSSRKLLKANAEHSNTHNKGIDDHSGSGLDYVGILEQLKGLVVPNTTAANDKQGKRSGSSTTAGTVADDFDGAMLLVNTPYPILVVQSTEDVFVDPKTAAVYSPAQLPPERTLVDDLQKLQEPNTVFITWLKAGHEVLQERTPFMLSLLSNTIKMFQIVPDKPKYDLTLDGSSNRDGPGGQQPGHSDANNAGEDDTASSPSRKSKASSKFPVKDLDDEYEKMMQSLGAGDAGDGAQTNFFQDVSAETANDQQNSPLNREESSIPIRAWTASVPDDNDQFDDTSTLHSEGDSSSVHEKRQQAAIEKLRRTQLNIERKKRQMRQSRQSQLEILYLREQEERDRQQERRETKQMTKEDKRSRFAAEYAMECEVAEISKKIAKEKAKELRKLRREEAIKKVEDELARKRSQRIEVRRAQATTLVQKIAQEELTLQGMRNGGYGLPSNVYQLAGIPPPSVNGSLGTFPDGNSSLSSAGAGPIVDMGPSGAGNDSLAGDATVTTLPDGGSIPPAPLLPPGSLTPKGGSVVDEANSSLAGELSQVTAAPANQRRIDVDGVIEATTRLVQDLFECRQKYLDAIKRANVLQEKHDLYIKQLLSLENEERRLRRAIRLLEINPSIIGAEMNAESQLQELQVSLRQKQETINEMSSVKTQREQQLYAANRSVQLLKLARKERDVLMSKRMEELYGVEAHFADRVKDLKMQKEGLTYKRDRLRLDMQEHQKRVDDLTKEMNRIRGHKGKLIDTDVWIPGVMQRCLTKELKKHLKQEFKKAEALVIDCEREIDVLRTQIFDLSDVTAQVKRDHTKMTKSIKIFYKTFQKFQATNVDELAKHMLILQQKADQLEARRKKEMDVDKVFAGNNADGINAVVDKVRLKESEIRTKDERQFVGIDLIMNPDQYLHLSPIEAEQMSFDDDYQCHLSKTDLERIMKLPEAVNLALPFLHTIEEVNAHRLINMFYRQRDDNHFRNMDFACYDRYLDAGQAAMFHVGDDDSALGLGGSRVGGGGGGSVAGSLMEEISMSILSSSQQQLNQKKQAAKMAAAAMAKKGGTKGHPSTSNKAAGGAAGTDIAEAASQTTAGTGMALLRGDMMGRIMAAMREVQDDAEVIHDILVKESLRDRIRHIFDDELASSLTPDEKKWLIIDKVLAPHVYGLEDADIEEEMERAKLLSREQRPRNDPYGAHDNDQANDAKDNARDQALVDSLNTSLTRAGNKYNTKKVALATTAAAASRPQSQHQPSKPPSDGDPTAAAVPVMSSDGDAFQAMRDQYEEEGEDLFGYAWHCPFSRAELEDIYRTPAILLKQKYLGDYKKQDLMMEVKALLDKYHVSEEESLLGNAKMSLLSDLHQNVITTVRRADQVAKMERESLRRGFEREGAQQRKVREVMRSFSQGVFDTPDGADSDVPPPAEGDKTTQGGGRKDKAAVVQQLFSSPAHAALARHGGGPGIGIGGPGSPRSSGAPANEDGDGDAGTVGMDGVEDLAGNDDVPDDFELRRIWGGWNQVHPASQGRESQKSFFMRATFNASRDHPAAYAVHDDEEDDDAESENEGMSDDDEVMSLLSTDTKKTDKKNKKKKQLRIEGDATGDADDATAADDETKELSPRSKGLKTLTAAAGGDPDVTSLRPEKKKKKLKRPRDVYLICESITELASYDPKRVRGRIALLQVRDLLPLFSISDVTLSARQSRSHYFSIPDRENQRVLELSVSVVFQGSFTTVGYKLGRLAAGLFRLPEPNPETLPGALLNTSPIPVGFSLHEHIQPNLPQLMGKVLIQHKPRVRPITPGHFQIVIGCAANTKYSIEVTAKYARAALPVIDEEIDRAKAMQVRLPNVLLELDMIAESLRLTERKLLVCEKMITEAELETQRAHQTMLMLQEKLEQDDEDMALLEDERRELQRELAICEVEYGQWSGLFASRLREKEDVKEGVQMMHNFRRLREEERTTLTETLEQLRQDLPACIRLLRTMTEAIHVAASLNTTYQGVGNEDTSHFYAPGSQSLTGEQVLANQQGPNQGNAMQVLTPAAEVRRTMKQFGFQVLTLEQQQWSVLDQHLNPHFYDPWLREQLEHDIQEAMSMGKVPKTAVHSIDDYYRANPVLEPYILSKNEIEYVIQSPFSMLSRREMLIRKLLTKFHDDPAKVSGTNALSAAAFDPHRAERTRAKNPRTYTKEEKEWVSIDQHLHPEIWKYYVNRSDNFLDPRAREASMEAVVTKEARKKNKKNRRSNSPPPKKPTAAPTTAAASTGTKTPPPKNGGASTTSPTRNGRDAATVSSLGTPSDLSTVHSVASHGAPPAVIPVDGDDFAALVARMQQSTTLKLRQQKELDESKANQPASGNWLCPFDKIAILKIWKTPKHLLKTEDERYTQRLLLKYNGTFTAYYSAHAQRIMTAMASSQTVSANASALTQDGAASVASDPGASSMPQYRRIQWEKYGKLVSQDVDERARQVLREIDRAATTRNEYISSDVLHGQDQRFPTQVLRVHLEEELDHILSEQILDRERAERYRVRLTKQQQEELNAFNKDATGGGDGTQSALATSRSSVGAADGGGTVLTTKAAQQEANFQRDHVLIHELPQKNASVLQKVQQRAKERQLRKQQLLNAHAPSVQSDVAATRRMLKKRAEKSTEILSDLILSSQLGEGACLACRQRRCQWRTSIDFDACSMRKRALDDEIERIRSDRDSTVFQSDVCLSAQLGGNNIFTRADVLDELTGELRDLNMYMELDAIDKELHDAFNSRKEYFECRALHGFSVLLWTNHARKALNDRQSRLVAMITAKEVVDDILSDMLEGWVFGERQSDFRVQGYVPSLSEGHGASSSVAGDGAGDYKKGFVRAGHAQLSSVMQVVMKMKRRAEARRAGVLEDESRRGEMLEKAYYEVELQQANPRRARLKIARENNEHEHLLNETERTLKFGIFMITLMYFRAMTFLKREQSSWAGENETDVLSAGGKNAANGHGVRMTDERMKMLHEEAQVAARRKKMDAILAKAKIGQARRAAREAQERRDAIIKLQSMIRRQRLEMVSVLMLQRVYRGHLGRKAAKRWALKRAELGAMHALLNATAITIQRYYRGYRARVFTIIKRMEMAQFIALMRVQESQQDEEVYWQTHPWSRFKRRQREWWHTKFEKLRGTDSGVLGGARLTEEEEARAQGKSLEEIRRAIEGLDELDEDGESTVADGGAGGSVANDLDTLTEGGESYRRSRRGGGGGVGGSSARTMGSDAAVSVADDDTIAS